MPIFPGIIQAYLTTYRFFSGTIKFGTLSIWVVYDPSFVCIICVSGLLINSQQNIFVSLIFSFKTDDILLLE